MLKGKNAIITGSNRGIGWATVEIFAQNHSNIWACARIQDDLFEKRLNELSERYNVNITAVYCDVANQEEVKNAFKLITQDTKKIDVLVNNAGISVEKLMSMTTINQIREVMEVNYFSQVSLAQMASRYMIKSRGGSIVNIASVAGMDPEQGGLAYGGSKAAVLFSTKTMALELGQYGVRVNAVSPGFIETDMWNNRNEGVRDKILKETPLGRQGKPEEVAETILFLASDMSSYITGQNIIVDGGRKMGGVSLSILKGYEGFI